MKLHFEGAEIRKYSTLLETIFYGSEVIQNGERVPISKLRPIDYKLFVKGEFWCQNVKGENFDTNINTSKSLGLFSDKDLTDKIKELIEKYSL